jgi:hypothetical protein
MQSQMVQSQIRSQIDQPVSQHLRFSLHAEISDQISVRSISQPAAIIKISLICSIKTFDAASQQPEH